MTEYLFDLRYTLTIQYPNMLNLSMEEIKKLCISKFVEIGSNYRLYVQEFMFFQISQADEVIASYGFYILNDDHVNLTIDPKMFQLLDNSELVVLTKFQSMEKFRKDYLYQELNKLVDKPMSTSKADVKLCCSEALYLQHFANYDNALLDLSYELIYGLQVNSYYNELRSDSYFNSIIPEYQFPKPRFDIIDGKYNFLLYHEKKGNIIRHEILTNLHLLKDGVFKLIPKDHRYYHQIQNKLSNQIDFDWEDAVRKNMMLIYDEKLFTNRLAINSQIFKESFSDLVATDEQQFELLLHLYTIEEFNT